MGMTIYKTTILRDGIVHLGVWIPNCLCHIWYKKTVRLSADCDGNEIKILIIFTEEFQAGLLLVYFCDHVHIV